MSKPAILFDLDGTLVDSLGDITASANHVRQHFNLPPLALGEVRGMVGDGAARLLQLALAEVGAPWTIQQAMALYGDHQRDQCTRLVQPYPSVIQHLQGWREDGHPMAVVSNKPKRFVHQILDHLALSEFFVVALGGDSSPERKPSPVPLFAALDRLGVPELGGLMVGDGLQDLQAGKAAGLRTAAVLFGFRNEATLRAEGADEYWREFGVPERLSGR